MSIKIKYASDGRKEAEVELDQSFIQDQNNRDGYMAMHEFISSVVGDKRQSCQSKYEQGDDSRPHNKSLPHYKADRKLAKFIIDNGGLKHLHGVHYINKQQVFFFDKSPVVQTIVERYNEQNDLQSDASHAETPTKHPKRKRSKKHKNKTAGQDQPTPVEERRSEVCAPKQGECVAFEQTDGAGAEEAGATVTDQEGGNIELEVMVIDE